MIAFRSAEIMWYHVDFLCSPLSIAPLSHRGSMWLIKWVDSCIVLAASLSWSISSTTARAPTIIPLPPCTFSHDPVVDPHGGLLRNVQFFREPLLEQGSPVEGHMVPFGLRHVQGDATYDGIRTHDTGCGLRTAGLPVLSEPQCQVYGTSFVKALPSPPSRPTLQPPVCVCTPASHRQPVAYGHTLHYRYGEA